MYNSLDWEAKLYLLNIQKDFIWLLFYNMLFISLQYNLHTYVKVTNSDVSSRYIYVQSYVQQ